MDFESIESCGKEITFVFQGGPHFQNLEIKKKQVKQVLGTRDKRSTDTLNCKFLLDTTN